MKVLAKKGRTFVAELFQFFMNVVKILNVFKLLWSVFLGMSAKLSLMVSFLVIVKLTSAFVMGDKNLLASDYMGVFLMFFIPSALFLSGSSLYFDMRFKIKYEHLFVRKLRKLNLQNYFDKKHKIDAAALETFFDYSENDFFRGLVSTFHALFELLQSVLITLVILSYLLYADWVIALILLCAIIIITPVFVYLGNKKYSDTANQAEKSKQALEIRKKGLYSEINEPVLVSGVSERVNAIVFGVEASAIKKEEDQRKLDSRKPFPFIYGFIGLMFVVLVYASLSGTDGNISPEKFGSWIVIFFALRFMAAAAQNLRNSLFSLFSNYKHVQQVNALLN